MRDLSILIPSRNEMFLNNTVSDILANREADTEIIVVLDGQWPVEGLPDDPRVRLIYHDESIGQRAATNEAARLSTAKYVMKADAHCSFDKGFDRKLMETCQPDWTVVPRMYNLHVFDWKCKKCGQQWYMGPIPSTCNGEKPCGATGEGNFERVMVWQPRWNRKSDYMMFDKDLHFQYWSGYRKRPEAKGEITDLMSCIGACWMMERERYWFLEGMDENHGSWGQMGTELSAKSHLSGGRMVINKTTWFSHMFRTQAGFGFPYPNPGIGARAYSQDLWRKGKWKKAVHPLSWLIKKYSPVPTWTDEEIGKLMKEEEK